MAEVNTALYSGAMPKDPMKGLQDTVGVANAIQQNRLLGQAEQSNAIGIDSAKIDLAAKQFGHARNLIGSLLTNPKMGKDDMRKDIESSVAQGMNLGLFTAQQAVEALKGVPNTPQEQRQWAQGHLDAILSATEKLNQYQPAPAIVSDQNRLRVIQTPPRAGFPASEQANIPLQVPPTTELTQGDPTKPNYGGKSLLGPAAQPPGLTPTAPRPAARAPVGSSVAPVAAKPLTTALPPGQAEASSVAGGASGGALGDARNRSLNYQQEVNPLEQAIPALEKLGTKGTGPGTESINHLKSFVLSNVPGADFKDLKDNVATYDKAKKYLTDFVNQNGNSGTNDKLAAAFAGNPSVNISNAAAVDVAKTALTLRRFKQAQLSSFEATGKPDADFAKEAGKFAREHDPRAYGFDMMTPAERKKVIESLPKGKRELFMMDVQDAASQGIIKAPQAK